jgi:hypothetical protein
VLAAAPGRQNALRSEVASEPLCLAWHRQRVFGSGSFWCVGGGGGETIY